MPETEATTVPVVTPTVVPVPSQDTLFKAHKLSETGSFDSTSADFYSKQWFDQHAHLVQGDQNVHLTTINGKQVKIPKAYFPTIETLDKKHAEVTGQTGDIPFQTDVTPLRFRGTYNQETQKVVLEMGLIPSPSIFSKMTGISGNLDEGPIESPNVASVFYKGKFEVELRGQEPDPSVGAVGINLSSLVAKVNWAGLGLNLAEGVIHLLKDIKTDKA